MNRKSKHARLLELGKDVLIVLLACSAVWLTTRVQRTGSLGDLLADTPQEGQGQTQAPGQMEMVRPVRMAAVGRSGETTIRYGAQYDQQSTDAPIPAGGQSAGGGAERRGRDEPRQPVGVAHRPDLPRPACTST